MNNVNSSCICGKYKLKKPSKEELDNFIAFLREFLQEENQPISKHPCLFDNLPDGAYGLACSCPKHGGMC